MEETEKKRHRFTPGDEDRIISGVLGHWEDLFGAQAHIRPRGSKTATWNSIAGTLTSAVARCGDDVRKKYNLIRNQIKQKVSSLRALSSQTGGGPNTVLELTHLEQQLLSRMAETVTGVGPADLGIGPSQGDISSSGPPPAAEESTVESALPSNVTMEEKAHLDVEKNRLQLDRERLRVETERLQVETERLQLEKDRLEEVEAREVRRQRSVSSLHVQSPRINITHCTTL
ncbi:hypothetical protein J4Q44_G00253870 [Coregonus suidteri]|uniref:Myb/SANT-like DNA-binding domain-containing protein n=1 Tax=Coregonus suidteri TaxID=861788 RepID=A0AAN8LNN7_9TELE